MTNAFVAAAQAIYGDSVEEMKVSLAGVSREGLNWQPAARDTNSLAALATHAMGSTRNWLCIAFDAPSPQRDRESEFLTTVDSAEVLLAYVDAVDADCRRLFETHSEIDAGAIRIDGEDRPTAAWSLLHAVEHLREHLGQIYLTRQLWEATP